MVQRERETETKCIIMYLFSLSLSRPIVLLPSFMMEKPPPDIGDRKYATIHPYTQHDELSLAEVRYMSGG